MTKPPMEDLFNWVFVKGIEHGRAELIKDLKALEWSDIYDALEMVQAERESE